MPEPTARGLSLMYFDHFKPDILGLLEEIEDPAGFDQEERLQPASERRCIASTSLGVYTCFSAAIGSRASAPAVTVPSCLAPSTGSTSVRCATGPVFAVA